jgi:hypothetical protein
MAVDEADDETAFATRSNDPVEARLCIAYARATNLLDPRPIDSLLADDVRYESQSVLDAICGRAEVGDYISGKLETIRQCGEDCLVRLELATQQDGAPCLIVHQRESAYGQAGLGRRVGTVLLDANESGQIQAILLATISPRPEECTPTGIFPGISAAELARERDHIGRQLESVNASLVVFLWPGSSWIDGMVANVREAARDLGIGSVRAVGAIGESAGDSEISSEMEKLGEAASEYGIVGYPTVCVFDGERLVRRIVGFHSAESLCAGIGDLFGR